MTAEVKGGVMSSTDDESDKAADNTADAEERVRRELRAQLDAQAQIEEYRKAEETRAKMRAQNSPEIVQSSRAAHAGNRQLKHDLKKTQSTVKKIKSMSEDQREALLKDIAGTNLTMYISEVVQNIVDSKLKVADMLCAIQVISEFHCRYHGFTTAVIPSLASIVSDVKGPGTSIGGSQDGTADDKEAARKRRQVFRLLIELFLVGVYQDVNLLQRLAKSFLPPKGGEGGEQSGGGAGGGLRFKRQGPAAAAGKLDFGLIGTLARYGGEELLGLIPRKMKTLHIAAGHLEEPKPPMGGTTGLVEEDVRAELRQSVSVAFEMGCQQLVSMHKSKQGQQKQAEKDRLLHGSLTEEKEKALEETKKSYDNHLKSMQTIADVLDRDLPVLAEEKNEDDLGSTGTLGLAVWSGEANQDAAAAGPYGDEETRSFYEDLPDLLAMLPSALLGLTEEEAQKLKKENSEKEVVQAMEATAAAAEEEAAAAMEPEAGQEVVSPEGDTEAEEGGSGQLESVQEEEEGTVTEDGAAEEEDEQPSAHHQLNHLLHEVLPACYNRDRADDFAVRFAHIKSRKAGKRLVGVLFNVPRQAFELLPPYSRIVATLDQVIKDIAPGLIADLQSEFRYFQRKKPNSHLESKIKTVKYIAELVKFRVAPPIVPFTVLKVCIENFTPHNVEVACALLESCGRYLYRTSYTHARLNRYLDIMMRIKKVRRMDPNLETMVDNAYYICNPPERSARKVTQYTPQQLYIRYLWLEKLQEDTVEEVLELLRRLPWRDPDAYIEGFIMSTLLKAAKGRFHAVHLIADVIAGLAEVYETFSLKLVDRLLEELTRGMEQMVVKDRDAQGYLALVKLLGELYNYALIPNTLIFERLYHFLNHGHEVPEYLKLPQVNPEKGAPPLPPPIAEHVTHDPRVPSAIDPPADTFRTQLVIKLLQSTGSYFVGGKSKARLDLFLTHFQRYLFCRGFLPPSTENDVLDLLDDLEAQVRSEIVRKLEVPTVEGGLGGKKTRELERERRREAEEKLHNVLPRYNSWEEAQAVVERVEKEEYEKKTAKGEDGKKGEGGGGETESEEEEGSRAGEEKRRGRGVEEEPESEEEGTTEEEGRGGSESSEEEVTEVRREAHVKTEEDVELEAEFEKAFASMMLNSVEERRSIARTGGIGADNMILPSTLPKLLGREGEEVEDGFDREEKENGAVNGRKDTNAPPVGVKLRMLKRGMKGKLEAKELTVPAYTSLAAQIRSHRDAEREEHNLLKQRVLQYETSRMEAGEEEALLPQRVYNAPLVEDDKGPTRQNSHAGGGRVGPPGRQGGREFRPYLGSRGSVLGRFGRGGQGWGGRG